MRPLRLKQEYGFNLLKWAFSNGYKRPMLQGPTGFGKTLLSSHIVNSAVQKGKRVVFCVDAITLIDQTYQAFWDEGLRDIGVIQSNHPMTNYSKPIQIASAQTLARRKIPDADLVIIDEAHVHYKAYTKWMESWNNVPFIGLSATPWTKGLGQHYDILLKPTNLTELIEDKLLTDFEVYSPSKADMSKCPVVAGDYHEGESGAIMEDPKLVADIVDNWLKNGMGLPTLCFCVDRARARFTQSRFQKAGVRCAYVDADTPREERIAIGKALRTGEVEVVCNIGTLTKGVDWDVRCIILARPTKSEMLFVQIIGRGLRTAEGKDKCLIFDHTPTHDELGFVTDIDYDELCDGSKKSKESKSQKKEERQEAMPKECPSCKFKKPAGTHVCPKCGFAPMKMDRVVEKKGELEKKERKKSTEKEKRNRNTSAEDKKAFFGGLIHYANGKGYARGWASNTYRDHFGVWPNAFKDAPAVPPNDAVMTVIDNKRKQFHVIKNATK